MSTGLSTGDRSRGRLALLVGALVVLLLAAGAVLVLAAGGTSRVAFDPDRGRSALPDHPQADDTTDRVPDPDAQGEGAPDGEVERLGVDPGAGTVPPPEPIEGRFESFLILGSDGRSGLGGERADVILLGLVPADGSSPILFSLPRDLWVANPCTGGTSRINAGLNGCGSQVSGPELMAIMVEDVTSVPIDHYVTVDFDGFEEVVDAVGGVRICNERPVRDAAWTQEWSMPAGCVDASGSEALGWVRSRNTQHLVDGEWRRKPGVDDLARNERQQEVLLQTVERLTSVRSPGQLLTVGRSLSDSVTLSESVSLVRMARLGWALRDTDRSDIRRFSLPVRHHRTSGGAQVLLLEEPIPDTFAREVGRPTG
jgi:LCP family protein required for cell wall assembly